MSESVADDIGPLIEIPNHTTVGTACKSTALGRLGELAAWYASTSGDFQLPQRARLLIVTGDHALGSTVSSAGEDPAPRAAPVEDWLDVAFIAPPSDTSTAFSRGRELAAFEADSGTDLLLVADSGRGATTVAATLVGLLTGTDVATVTGRGAGIDDEHWMRKAAVVRDLCRQARPSLGDPVELLAAIGSPSAALSCGLLLESSARRTPVLLDGFLAAAAGLVAQRIAYRAPLWWQAAGVSVEPAHRIALNRLDLDPILDLGIRRSVGFTATLVAMMLRETLAR